MSAGSAHADDLLVLNGDSETLSGSQQYGLVYIDGDLRLAGDTSISASSIYIGPDASLISCFVAGTGDNGCTAGRSLTLQSSGPLTVAIPIDLTGGTGAVQPGGNLSLSGGPVSVAGDITTAGSGGGPSGQVSISSSSSLAIGGIYAPGAPVTLNASGPIDVGNDIQTEGTDAVLATDPTRVPSAGPVTVNSSGGDVRIDGSVSAYGQDAAAPGGLGGGNAGAVTITGSDVRTEDIDTTGGGSAASVPGSSAPIAITARGALRALGQLNASGQDGAGGTATPGAQITLNAAGPLTIGGAVNVSGGQSAGGGTIAIGGATVASDELLATGGDGSGAMPAGGPGGTIGVTAPSGASLGNLTAYGGGSQGGAAAGGGGAINVTSSAGSIAVGKVETEGGYQNTGSGAAGGPITLSADGDLSVGGGADANGSDAGGSADPPWSGGNAGPVTLRAATGTLSLGGNTTAQGGAGGSAKTNGALGGTGGSGGQIVVVAHAIGALASLSSAGGQGGGYGDTQGAGGPGGAIFAWTNAPIFNSQELVSSDGGDGNPTGVAGTQHQESSPTALVIAPSTGVLSFTSQSPDAQDYSVLMSVDGAAPVTALTSTATSGLQPNAPLCVPVSFTVVAVNNAVGWTSDPSAAVDYTRQPSPTQGCSDAPKIAAATPLRRSLRQLRRAHWVVTLPLEASGIGQLQATLEQNHSVAKVHKRGKRSAGKRHKRHERRAKASAKTIVTVSMQLTSPGTHVLRLPIPAAARALGGYSVRLTTTSPDGKGHLETTLTLELVR